MAVKQFERLFREAASLDIDKSDIKRLEDFINARLHDLLLLGEIAAKANGRDVIEVHDLPITKGLQASLRSRERFWDIRVPKIDSIFDNSLVPRPSWSPGVPPQHRKLVAATHRSPI